MSRLPRDNNPAEIEAFDTVCHRLGGFDERISTEWVDGYLSALAAGPRGQTVADWLPVMAGDAYDRAFADPDDRMNAERALKSRFVVLVDQLDAEALYDAPDQLRLSPLMQPWDDEARAELLAQGGISADEVAELATGAVWAEGFGTALRNHAEAWAKADADDEAMALFSDLVEQVRVLLLPDGSDELREHVAGTYRGETVGRDRLIDEACFAVQDLHLWWVDHAPRPETRRVEKAPGRNDPCPCGSGRKFKKCHGAAL